MEKEKVFENAFLSFKTFLLFIILSGLITSLTGVIFHIFSFLLKFLTGEPNLSFIIFFKPFLSIIIDPLDALIAGCLFYPVYKIIAKKYWHFVIKIRVGDRDAPNI